LPLKSSLDAFYRLYSGQSTNFPRRRTIPAFPSPAAENEETIIFLTGKGRYVNIFFEERAMKRFFVFSSLLGWALTLFLFPAPSPAGDPQAGSSDPLKTKTKEEMEAVKKDSRRIGEEALQSARELPAQAGKGFKETGSALKETGKELKESIKETAEDIKKMFKK
jgi:hypothetical protein